MNLASTDLGVVVYDLTGNYEKKRQKEDEFKATLGCIARPSLKKNT